MSAWRDMGEPGAGSGQDVTTAYNAVWRDIAACLAEPSEFDDLFAHYRRVQIHEREQREADA